MTPFTRKDLHSQVLAIDIYMAKISKREKAMCQTRRRSMSKENEKIFTDALRGLNKVQTPLADNSLEESAIRNHDSFRDDLMMDILKDHPGLTYEELDKQMSAFGF